MREAVIVSTARTPIGRAYRGAFNDTQAQTLGGHAIEHAVQRAGVDAGEIDDVVMGAAMQQGSTYMNVARQSALRAGLPTSVAGMSVDRQCASGLMAIAIAAKQIVCDAMQTTVGGGLESISLVQNEHANTYRFRDPWLVAHRNDVYMSMLERRRSSHSAMAFRANARTNMRCNRSSARPPRRRPAGSTPRSRRCRA